MCFNQVSPKINTFPAPRALQDCHAGQLCKARTVSLRQASGPSCFPPANELSCQTLNLPNETPDSHMLSFSRGSWVLVIVESNLPRTISQCRCAIRPRTTAKMRLTRIDRFEIETAISGPTALADDFSKTYTFLHETQHTVMHDCAPRELSYLRSDMRTDLVAFTTLFMLFAIASTAHLHQWDVSF